MTPAPPSQERAHTHRRLVVLLQVLAAVVAVMLLQALVAKPFGVPSRSMEQTLRIGDRILVGRVGTSLQRGDVIVFSHGSTWEQRRLPPAGDRLGRAARGFGDLTGLGPSNTAYTVKRIIGLPGDAVHCCSTAGRVVVDGTALDEPYVYDDLPFEPGRLDCTSSPPVAAVLPRGAGHRRLPPPSRRPPVPVGGLGGRVSRLGDRPGVRPAGVDGPGRRSGPHDVLATVPGRTAPPLTFTRTRRRPGSAGTPPC